MEDLLIQLDDLPDEILLVILEKMSNIEVLYSLIGVNRRLSKIVHDSIFANRLTLMRFVPSHLMVMRPSSRYFIYPLVDPILNRFCFQILPEIHHQIKWLNLELFSIKRILLASSYPSLNGLGLYNVEAETAIQLFSDETLFSRTLKTQICSLVVEISTNGQLTRPTEGVNVRLFLQILTVFSNLRYLNIGPSSIWYQTLSFDIPPPSIISSNLLELHVSLRDFIGCLYLLDGRFNKLRRLHVSIEVILFSTLTIDNKEKLPNLRSFSLYSNVITEFYDELILPLLHRMTNLEELDLSLIVSGKKAFVEGNDLKTNIINHMTQLSQFTFNIHSSIRPHNQTDLPSTEDIQKTFKDFQGNQIISCVDYFPSMKTGECHVYSYPYKLKHYNQITNHFRGGLFQCVREVSLYDERPFEHEFFLQISQSFPLMENLTVINRKRQKNKPFRKSKNENPHLSIIAFPQLIELDLNEAHKDYHEQFLFDTKTCLPNRLRAVMNYRLVKKVTRNFRRCTSRKNCAKIGYAIFSDKSTFPEHFKDYFPNAHIF